MQSESEIKSYIEGKGYKTVSYIDNDTEHYSYTVVFSRNGHDVKVVAHRTEIPGEWVADFYMDGVHNHTCEYGIDEDSWMEEGIWNTFVRWTDDRMSDDELAEFLDVDVTEIPRILWYQTQDQWEGQEE